MRQGNVQYMNVLLKKTRMILSLTLELEEGGLKLPATARLSAVPLGGLSWQTQPGWDEGTSGVCRSRKVRRSGLLCSHSTLSSCPPDWLQKAYIETSVKRDSSYSILLTLCNVLNRWPQVYSAWREAVLQHTQLSTAVCSCHQVNSSQFVSHTLQADIRLSKQIPQTDHIFG